MKKIVLFISLFVLIAIVGVVAFVNYLNKRSLPLKEGIEHLSRLTDKVEVYFDDYGMPHIIAENELDLYRTAGYITARDRMWQMDLIRRATQGRLSEIFGKDFVETDLLLRALDIPNKSERIYATMSDEMKTLLEAYADGINQYIEQYDKKLPFEFFVLGYKPEQWLPQHSLNIIGFMAWDLETAWEYEITLFNIQNKVDSNIFKLFVPDFSTNSTVYEGVVLPQIKNPYAIVSNSLKKLGLTTFSASNNWAVGPSKTKDNKPILCNDMHLGYGIPGIWYHMHLIVEGKLNVTGVTIPGAPGIVSGHNNYIAWGMTNVMLDGADFYVETINEDTTKYLLDGNWIDLKVTYERIPVSKKDTIVRKLLWTHRGPIISQFKDIKNKAISMRWVGNIMSNEFEGIYTLNHARNWRDFLKGVSCFKSISQNFVYADEIGNIGLKMGGSVPIRKIPGYYIYRGDTSAYDWQGYVPFDSLPVVFNPSQKFVASANNKSTNTKDYYISQYFFQDYRYSRIVELLDNKDTVDVVYMKQMLNDKTSKFAQKLLPFIIDNIKNLSKKDKLDLEIFNMLQSWNCELTAESPSALFFEVFNIFFVKNSISDELSTEIYNDYISSKIFFNHIIQYLVQNTQSPLYDDVTTPEKETINDIFARSYSETKRFLIKNQGKDTDKWAYGNIHTLLLQHPLGKVWIINLLFNLNRGPYHVGGSNHTVCPYSYNHNDLKMHVKTGASQRHIYNLANWDESLIILPTGQSGIPASYNYCNQTNMFIDGQMRKDVYSIEKVRQLNKKLVLSSF